MKIIYTRRISQIFFFCLFLWFCIVATFGSEWWQLRGWPVNLFLQLDPLVAIGTLLSTHTIYRGLIWALLTIITTIILGRVFCGWVCPFGAMHQFIGWLGSRRKTLKQRIALNRYRKAAFIKYLLLIAFLVAAAIPLTKETILLTGILDPIPLAHRSFNVIVIPIADSFTNLLSVTPRVYEGSFLIGAFFLAALLMNLLIPRFYCRFICPTGALLGLIGKYSLWRIGKSEAKCSNCMQCEKACEGACSPSGEIRINECVLCFNCYHYCKDGSIKYQARESKGGEASNPDLTRRGLIVSSLSGLLAVQFFPLSTGTAAGDAGIIRPPGSLPESEFLNRCIRCGQCMRICPTNIIVPSGIFSGIENLWTPVLNFTDGTSGCQLNCTACGHVCPTSAIRPITLSEKIGTDEFSEKGPIRIGSAYIDRSRCLPWAMNRPCIVCQENCPVTPKAIYVTERFETVREGEKEIISVQGNEIRVSGSLMAEGQYATGDYYISIQSQGVHSLYRISANGVDTITADPGEALNLDGIDKLRIQVCLHQPNIDITRCIGCGTCVHECPVGGARAIRVTPDNESRGMKKVA
ncbi:MAG: 4Fe-4S binding protein [Deltaproteobacteria bacterium]|nr:4Fe-4S binding protein [Deltaproteobacteria bacterium]